MRTNIFYWFMGVLFVFPASSVAEKITAKKVIQNYVASYEKQMKGIKDITIITDMDRTYQKWMTEKGKTICKTRHEIEVMGKEIITIYDGTYQWQKNPMLDEVTKEKIDHDPYQIIESLKTTPAKYGGIEKIDEFKTHILNIKDITELMGSAKPEGMEKVKASGKLWVDAKDWVIRKMEIDIKGIDEKDEKKTAKITIERKDFRKVNGLLIPYRTITTVGGEATKLSPEREEEMRKGLAEMQKQLEAMPAGQREMVEKMMKPQMEMMQKTLGAGGRVIETEIKKVKINTGLSDDLFDGSKLK